MDDTCQKHETPTVTPAAVRAAEQLYVNMGLRGSGKTWKHAVACDIASACADQDAAARAVITVQSRWDAMPNGPATFDILNAHLKEMSAAVDRLKATMEGGA